MTVVKELNRLSSASEISNLFENDKVGIYAAKTYMKLDGVSDDYQALYDLINTTINGDNAEIWVKDGNGLIGSDITIPSNIKLKSLNGGILKPDTGITITINGLIEAGSYQIFDITDGTITGDILTPIIYSKWFGVVADRTTDNTALINTIIDSLPANKVLYIEKNVLWSYTGITHKEDVVIFDDSGYDYANADWTSQIRVFLNTSDNESKNGNEYILNAPSHPSFIVDNKGNVATSSRASFITRQNGASKWRMGHGIYNGDVDFLIADFSDGDGAVRFSILSESGEIGVGLIAVSGVAYSQFNATNITTNILRHYTTNATDKHSLQYLNNNSIVSRKDIDQNGVETYENGGKVKGSRIYPNNSAIDKTLSTSDSNSICTNIAVSGGIVFTLPLATAGTSIDFVCTDQPLEAKPRTGETIRGFTASHGKRSAVVGSCLTLKCVIDGYWEVFVETGTWTDVSH